MADDWAADGEVSEVAMESEAPAAVIAEIPEIKLFGKWSCEDVQVAITLGSCCQIVQRTMSGSGHVPAGLHRGQGEVRQVPPSLCWQVTDSSENLT